MHYASRSLNTAERNYSTIERELLAIIYATDKFRYYLYGKKFTIITDHNPLVYLNNITLSSERLTRWRLKLAEYDFDIVYRKGKANANADAMSRVESTESQEPINDNLDTLFNINDEKCVKVHKTELLNAISTTGFKNLVSEDKLVYNNKDILEKHANEAIVISIPANIEKLSGVAKTICESYGSISSHKRHKLKVGSCYVKQGNSTIIFLVTKKHISDTPSYENFENFLKDLRENCNKLKIKLLAFPKYGAGLDKLDWNIIKELLNRVLTKEIQCTVYLNNEASRKIVLEENLDINSKIKNLQKQDKFT